MSTLPASMTASTRALSWSFSSYSSQPDFSRNEPRTRLNIMWRAVTVIVVCCGSMSRRMAKPPTIFAADACTGRAS